ncbi:MAG: host specificity protein, partial [Rhodobacteraceae bacterium]|nr:host specificity protein [Paracoccaceae bacterium]
DLPEAKRGLARHYRIGPGGRPVDDPSYGHAVMAFDGVGLRPLSPVHLRLEGDAGQDRTLHWMRRTRIDGDRWDIPDVPLGEETESYVIRVIQGDAVIREAASTGSEWTYTAAAQAQDALSGPYALQVAQVSARFGVGRFAVLDVT